MIPETEGEWPLVNHIDTKKWRTSPAYQHAKTVLKSSKAPKPLESIVENCNDDAIATLEGRSKEETTLTGDVDNEEKEDLEEEEPEESKLVSKEDCEKLRHYYRWVSTAQRAMHDAYPFIAKVCTIIYIFYTNLLLTSGMDL